MRKQPLVVFALGLAAATFACGGDPGAADNADDSSISFVPSSILSCQGLLDSDSVETGDFDGDGQVDIVGCQTKDSVTVFLNHGGSFDPSVVSISGLSFVQTQDVDGDGRTDIFRENDYGLTFAFSNGDGTFRSGFQPVTNNNDYCRYYTPSFDGYSNSVCQDYANGSVTVYDMVTDGSMEKAFTTSAPGLPLIADMDADGKPDFVYPIGSTIAIQHYLGNGGFGALDVAVTADDTAHYPSLVDVDGDGRTDMVVEVGSSSPYTYAVIHNEPDGFVTWSQFAEVDGVHYKFTDATGDGKMDIILSQDAQIVVMIGNGDGTFEKQGLLLTGAWSGGASFLFTDLNGDRKPDLLVGGHPLSILLQK